MITLENLHKATSVAKTPRLKLALEVLAGKKKGTIHSKQTWRLLRQHGLVDEKGKLTLLGMQSLDN